jgi:Family of unknown function (DUF6623)
MALHASWVHGNALTVESPENLEKGSYFGWGADLAVIPGKNSWFHIPLPTPVIIGDKRATVQKFFLLFKTDGGAGNIRSTHIYDGAFKVQEFNGLDLQGDHLVLDQKNTFILAQPHTVAWGMCISFFFQASDASDSQASPAHLIVGSAGGDFFA